MLNVSRATVIDAKAVIRDGTPEEIKAVQQREAAVSQVARNVNGRGVATRARTRSPNLGALRSSVHGGRRRDTPGLVDGGTDRT
jgi:hypothetical protein